MATAGMKIRIRQGDMVFVGRITAVRGDRIEAAFTVGTKVVAGAVDPQSVLAFWDENGAR